MRVSECNLRKQQQNIMEEESNNASTLTPPPFQMDEKVYCQDSTSSNSQYYEAVIRKARFVSDKWSFLVHYAGWNNRWDRWLDSDSILKDTAENRATVQQQQQQQQQENPGAPESSISGQKRSRDSSGPKQVTGSSGRKRLAVRNGDAVTSVDGLVYADYCELPFTLKTVLVEEYERIASPAVATAAATGCDDKPRRLVHQLPAPVTVRKVLNHFCKKKLKECHKAASAAEPTSSPTTAELVQSFCQGLTQLFQEALPVCLLYPQERPQYSAITVDRQKEELVDVYGCEYLLRLYVRLPILLQTTAAASTKEWSPTVIGPLLTDLLVLMQKNRQALFPMTVSAAESANYRAPVLAEWMDWEHKLYGNGDDSSNKPPSPAVEMDTR